MACSFGIGPLANLQWNSCVSRMRRPIIGTIILPPKLVLYKWSSITVNYSLTGSPKRPCDLIAYKRLGLWGCAFIIPAFWNPFTVWVLKEQVWPMFHGQWTKSLSRCNVLQSALYAIVKLGYPETKTYHDAACQHCMSPQPDQPMPARDPTLMYKYIVYQMLKIWSFARFPALLLDCDNKW
jgi:hypothetical protein